ncbi:MAG: CRISPR system precrRNA processing endoribonuclease RAMP protein Cas6 [Leptospiraceae bacterium]|nr:CRISPR system precrRNA processing endoribonuclease RAMP protein Cas6 [Leptospiraceae bacterium]
MNDKLKSRLNFSKVIVKLKSQDHSVLPKFLGSTIRGVFGHSLKQAFCVVSHKNCNICLLSDSCGYFQIFESLDETKKEKGYFYKPHPYIISIPKKNEYSNGDSLEFSITIFGDSIRYLPYLIYSFELMGKKGFGVNRNKFELYQVSDFYSNNQVYNNGRLEISNVKKWSLSEFVEEQSSDSLKKEFQLSFETPARFIENKKVITQLESKTFLMSMTRRYKILHEFYGQFEQEDLELGNIQLLKLKDQHYTSWKRFSNRQNKSMEQGGILGSYLVSFFDSKMELFLKSMEVLHVGKGTTFGLGRFKLEKFNN